MKIMRHVFVSGLGLFLPLLASAQCFVNDKEVPCPEVPTGVIAGLGVFFVLMLIIGLIGLIFWFWMLIHAIMKPIENKAMWIILMIIFQIPVSIVYFFVVKRKFQDPPVAPVQPAV